ncbi:MAG: type II toxin-antitoxin system VapC family toxin [Stackebrandtia sp.]
MIYLDSCAVIKLIKPEVESEALVAWLNRHASTPRVSSTLLDVEMGRALRRDAPELLDRLPGVLARIHRFDMTEAVRSQAASFSHPHLHTLDAIHLATAYPLRSQLTAFVTYDKRFETYAAETGLTIESPS